MLNLIHNLSERRKFQLRKSGTCAVLTFLAFVMVGGLGACEIAAPGKTRTKISAPVNRGEVNESGPTRTIEIDIGDKSGGEGGNGKRAAGVPVGTMPAVLAALSLGAVTEETGNETSRKSSQEPSPGLSQGERGQTRPAPAPAATRATEVELPSGEKFTVPEGMRAKVTITETGGVIGASASATGSGIDTSSDEAAGKFSAKNPAIDLPRLGSKRGGGVGKGSSSGFDFEVASLASGFGVLYVLGGLMVLGGAVIAGLTRRFVLAAFVAGAGGALIAAAILAETAPWLFAVGGVLALGVGAYLLWDWLRGDDDSEAAYAIVGAVESVRSTDPAIATRITEAVAKKAESAGVAARVKKAVTRIKGA